MIIYEICGNMAAYGSLEMSSNMAGIVAWSSSFRSPSDEHFESLKLPLFVIWSIVLWLCGKEEKLYARIKLTLLAWLHLKTYFSWVNIK